MAPKPPLSALQARYAALTRDRDPDDPELIEAKHAFVFARFEGRLAEFLADAPTLSEERLQKIAAMLKAGSSTPLRD
jgi:hypothetical protein